MNQYPARLAEMIVTPRRILDDLSVVIPTLGRPILETCFQFIVDGSAWPAQLIVIDQSSSQTVAAMLGNLRSLGLNAEYVPSTKRGRASGVNRGIERVRTRFVAVTDDDCFVDRDWLQNMQTRLRENPGAIITGRVDPEGGEEVVALRTSRTPRTYHRPLLKHDSVCGGNMGVATAVIDRVGLFDEDPRLGSAEDGEWSYRALRSGVQVIYAPEVAVRHFGWRNAGQRASQYHVYARSQGGFYGKYLRRGDWFIAVRIVIHLMRALRRWIRGIITGDPELKRHGRAYVIGLLPGIIAGWRNGRSS